METLPDGNEQIVYSNYAGQPLLKVFKETSTGTQWRTFFKYGDTGQLLWSAAPSATGHQACARAAWSRVFRRAR